MLVFDERRKLDKNLSDQRRELKTKSTHIWLQLISIGRSRLLAVAKISNSKLTHSIFYRLGIRSSHSGSYGKAF